MSILPVSAGGVPLSASDVQLSPGGAISSGGFGQLLDQLLSRVQATEANANQAVQDLALGRTENIHSVLLSVAQADLTFRLALEIRNKLTDAMQELMRMQV